MNNGFIVFCFPHKQIGGVSNQFLRVATKMKSMGHQVAILDYADGAMGRECNLLGLKLIEYKEDDFARIPENSVLIMQSMTPWTIWRGIDVSEKPKILFWSCHPDNFIPHVPLIYRYIKGPKLGKYFFRLLFPLFFKRMKSYIQKLNEELSLIHIDLPCKSSIEDFYDLKLNDNNIVPVPVPNLERMESDLIQSENVTSTNKDLSANKKISFGWIGRISDSKYQILLHAIRRVAEESDSMSLNVDFHIIGDGPLLEKLKREVNKVLNINIIFHGELNQKEITRILMNQIQLVFSMGTSALEAAAKKVPTVLLNFTYDKTVVFHKFDWLFNQKGFSVGKKIENRPNSDSDNLNIILKDFLENELELGIKCLEYVSKNHSLDFVVHTLRNHIDQVCLTLNELRSLKIYNPPLSYRIYKKLNS